MALTCPSLHHRQCCFYHPPPRQIVVPCGTLRCQSGFIICPPIFCVCHSCIRVCKERKSYRPDQIHTLFYALACKWINIQCFFTHRCARTHSGRCCQAGMLWLMNGSVVTAVRFSSFVVYVLCPCPHTIQPDVVARRGGVCLCFHLSGSLFICAWAELFRSERSFLPVLAPVATTIWSDKLQCLDEWELSQLQPLPTAHLLSRVGNAALKLVSVPFWHPQPYEWWTARNRPDGKGEQKPTHRFPRLD